jgi:hypothetical protein
MNILNTMLTHLDIKIGLPYDSLSSYGSGLFINFVLFSY